MDFSGNFGESDVHGNYIKGEPGLGFVLPPTSVPSSSALNGTRFLGAGAGFGGFEKATKKKTKARASC